MALLAYSDLTDANLATSRRIHADEMAKHEAAIRRFEQMIADRRHVIALRLGELEAIDTEMARRAE